MKLVRCGEATQKKERFQYAGRQAEGVGLTLRLYVVFIVVCFLL